MTRPGLSRPREPILPARPSPAALTVLVGEPQIQVRYDAPPFLGGLPGFASPRLSVIVKIPLEKGFP